MGRRGKWPGRLAFILLVWGVVYLYVPAVDFGFIWDDPVWYGHAWGKNWWQTLLPTTDFQFYRPVSMLYVWLFLREDGTFAIELLHWMQIGWHLLNVALAYAIGRRLGLGQWAAWALAALLALFPFAYQAVAWAAPNQPMVGALQNGAWFAYLMGRCSVISEPCSVSSRQGSVGGRWYWWGGSLLLFGLALTVQESSVAVAFVPLLYEFVVRLRFGSWGELWQVVKRPFYYNWFWATTYPMIAFLFGLVWLSVPRQAGITGLTMQLETAVYLAQVLIYPLLGRPWGYAPDFVLGAYSLLGLVGVSLIGLLLLARRNGRGRVALFGLLWALCSMAPLFVGLHFEYVKLADRLFYAPALGVVLLWSVALWPAAAEQPWPRFVTRYAGAIVWLLIVAQSVWLLLLFGQMYQRGTTHLQTALNQMSQENGRYLFINFPDRYLQERPFYPVGIWGVTLAPVVVDLADFLPITTGNTATATSYSMPWLDSEARADSPYQVDMRGVIIQPDILYQQALEYDAIYVSRYDENGRFHLEKAGARYPTETAACPYVLFNDIICLHRVQVTTEAEQLRLGLDWSTTAPIPPHITVFVHVGRQDIAPPLQDDGDSWRGLLPLTSWQAGHLIRDERVLPFVAPHQALEMRIGIYNWVEGSRWPAAIIETDGTKRPLSDNFYQFDYNPE